MHYIIAIIAIIIAAILIKNMVSCLFRTIVTFVLLALLTYLYFNYLS